MAPAPWISEDGDAIAYYAGGAFAGAESNRGSQNVYLARRTDLGWQTEPLVVPSRLSPNVQNTTPYALSTDLRKALFLVGNQKEVSGNTRSDIWLLIRESDGSYLKASPEFSAPPLATAPVMMGSAPDLSSVVLLSSFRVGSGDSGSGNGLYVVSGTESGSPQVHRIDVDNADPPVPLSAIGLDGAYTLGDNFHFVSDDDSTVFMTAGGNLAGTTHGSLYVRHLAPDGTGTTTTVAPAGSTLLAGSADGSRAIFSSAQPLVAGDTDSTADLYEYDDRNPAGEQLVQLSAGDPAGANFLGLLRSSDDATHAYFVATGVLTSDPNEAGGTAQAGADNLYLNERVRGPDGDVHSRTAFIDLLCSGVNASGAVADPGCGGSDAGLWALASNRMVQASVGDGRYLVFASFAQLTPDDTDAAQDIYRYDSQSGEITRISHSAEGFGNGGNGAVNAAIAGPQFRVDIGMGSNVYSQRNTAMSTDGSVVVFETTEALAPGDDNNALDAYAWHADPGAADGGTVSMITSGHDTAPLTSVTAPAITDSSGKDVFFAATEALVTQDNDNGLRDVYDARIDGGYPAVHPGAQCDPIADPTLCQGPPGPPPGDRPAGSTGSSPSGNAAPLAQIAVSTEKAVTGPRSKIKVTTPAAGTLTISGPGIHKVTKAAWGVSTFAITVVLNSNAKKRLQNGRQVSVPVTVAFRSDSGSNLTKGISLKFRPPAQKHKGHAKQKGSH